MLTKNQLEDIKQNIGLRIGSGEIEYSKDRCNFAEVMAYARSMVMNHLKKAKELNSNQIYGVGSTTQTKQLKVPVSLDETILSDDLKALVKTLV